MIFACTSLFADHPARQVDQVVIWGHKLHSHTHSYIHWGFKRAFEHLGYKVHWLDNGDNISKLNLKNSLFITEGQVYQNMPVRNDSYYILHNCPKEPYQHLLDNGHAIILQVYSHDCLKRKEPSFSYCFHYDLAQPIIYMPWATDLLPHEINDIKAKMVTRKPKKRTATFVGTIAGGTFGNTKEIDGFKRACKEQGISFNEGGTRKRSMEENITMIQDSLLAPAIEGTWQCENGYIPCRIFKNISYGNGLGITNNEAVYNLFNKKIIYDADSYKLGKKAIAAAQTITLEQQYELMDFVRDNHTYLNRIESFFTFFETVQNNKDSK